MILNLKEKEKQLPAHIRSPLVGLTEKSLAALRTYVDFMGVDVREIGTIVFDDGFGDISSKCQWASEIAAEFECIVEFQHNNSPAICYPTTAQAAYESWSRLSKLAG